MVVRKVSNILNNTVDEYHVSLLIELCKRGHTDTNRDTFRPSEMQYPVFHELLFLQFLQKFKTCSGI